ncbi:MAG: lamin tail domain-containing protein [Phycisphaerae bacterium]|nr:lamin tail domain-containing protein [Phycisphaerae bacterium]
MRNIGMIGWLALAVVVIGDWPALAQIRITEYMYNSSSASTGEFVELTNLGSVPVDFTGWSFDDNSRVPGSTSLSAFGVVAPGQSVVLTDAVASAFIAAWNLSGVSVIGGNTNNLGRADEINIYDASNSLVDRLTYDDQTYPGTPRTNGISAWALVSGPGPFGIIDSSWRLSAVGDMQGSIVSTGNDIGNPGRHIIPEPVGFIGALSAGGLMARRRRLVLPRK